MAGRDNPFERFDLDPFEGPAEITERLRELAEVADDAERAALRRAWEELTLHPRDRVRAALRAHPDSRPALPRRAKPKALPDAGEPRPEELLAPPSVAEAVGGAAPLPDLPLTHDPLFGPRGQGDPHVR